LFLTESTTMALLPSLYTLTIPFILLFSVPLALFASLTSVLAFSILIFRVLIVYAELAVAVIPHYILRFTSSTHIIKPPSQINPSKPFSASTSPPASTSPARRRSRRRESTSSSNASLANILSSSDLTLPIPPPLPVQESIGAQRDFEGVGGWRLDPPSDDDYLWTHMNSRLELPAEQIRRHRRSLTSGSSPLEHRRGDRSYSPEMTMMSPNTSRARTPRTPRTPPNGMGGQVSETGGGTAGGGYFATHAPTATAGTWSPKNLKKAASVTTLASGSSESSKGSAGGLSMKDAKSSS